MKTIRNIDADDFVIMNGKHSPELDRRTSEEIAKLKAKAQKGQKAEKV